MKEVYILYDLFSYYSLEFFKSQALANKRRNEWVKELKKGDYSKVIKRYECYPELLEVECHYDNGCQNYHFCIKKLSKDTIKELKFR